MFFDFLHVGTNMLKLVLQDSHVCGHGVQEGEHGQHDDQQQTDNP